MQKFRALKWMISVAAVALGCAIVSACGGGNTSVPTIYVSSPAPSSLLPTPAPLPTIAPNSTVLTPGTAAVTSVLTVANGIGTGLTLPPATSGSGTISVQAIAPASAPSFPPLPAGSTPLAYYTATASAALTLGSSPQFNVTLPSALASSGNQYYMALYDPTKPTLGWQLRTLGPGGVNGSLIMLRGSTLPATIASGVAYTYVLYQQPATGPIATTPIQHVIVVIQENRTFDNLFDKTLYYSNNAPAIPYPNANTVDGTGFVPQQSNGSPAPLAQVDFTDPYDPEHDTAHLHTEWNNGALNGFNLDTIDRVIPAPSPPATYPYAYVNPQETYLYTVLAQHYGVADNFFSSKLVPTFPGHQFLISGQSGAADDPVNPSTNPAVQLAVSLIWGCDSPPGSTAAILQGSPEVVVTPGPFPCYDYQTLGDLMDAKGVSWKYYTGTIGGLDGAIDAYDAIQHIRNAADWTSNISTPEYNIFSDIQNCNLPSVSYVTPPAAVSDHAGTLNPGGPGWVANIYLQMVQNSLIQANPSCQYYNNTAVLITWDDSGGWYDHVTPPLDNQGNPWGLRVPLIVASAWASSAYTSAAPVPAKPFVSHVQRDFGSIIRFIENNWNLGQLPGNQRDQGDGLTDMFNFAGPPVPPIAFSASALSQVRSIASIKALDATYTRPLDDAHEFQVNSGPRN